jgi:hypothetical protein
MSHCDASPLDLRDYLGPEVDRPGHSRSRSFIRIFRSPCTPPRGGRGPSREVRPQPTLCGVRLAQQDRRVVLLSADLPRPRFQEPLSCAGCAGWARRIGEDPSVQEESSHPKGGSCFHRRRVTNRSRFGGWTYSVDPAARRSSSRYRALARTSARARPGENISWSSTTSTRSVPAMSPEGSSIGLLAACLTSP